VIVDTLDPSASLDGVLRVSVGPKPALDRQRGGPSPFPVLPISRGRWLAPCADGVPTRPRCERLA
jgi:hypothetical protein